MNGGGNLPVGPGIWGFIAFFVLAVALGLLVRNMNSRLRRMAYRDRDRAEEFAADAEVDGSRRGGAAAATPATPAEPTDARRADGRLPSPAARPRRATTPTRAARPRAPEVAAARHTPSDMTNAPATCRGVRHVGADAQVAAW